MHGGWTWLFVCFDRRKGPVQLITTLSTEGSKSTTTQHVVAHKCQSHHCSTLHTLHRYLTKTIPGRLTDVWTVTHKRDHSKACNTHRESHKRDHEEKATATIKPIGRTKSCLQYAGVQKTLHIHVDGPWPILVVVDQLPFHFCVLEQCLQHVLFQKLDALCSINA